MIIRNALVYGEDKTFSRLDIRIEEDVFTEICPSLAPSENESVLDADGLYAIPGLIDIHFHGCMGHDFCDGDAKGLKEIAEYEKSCGITSFCPTSMTFSESRLSGIFETINYLQPSDNLARVAGINMEGPFISSSKKGAQNKKYIQN